MHSFPSLLIWLKIQGIIGNSRNMGKTSMKSPSAKNTYFTVLRKEDKTNNSDLLVIFIWMLMVICEIKRSIQSLWSEMESASFNECSTKRMYQMQYLLLPPKVLYIKTNTIQNTDFSYTSFGVSAWTVDASEKQITVKSSVKKKYHQLIELHDYFRPKPTRIFAYPSSIRTYVEDVLRTPHASQLDLMRHEWARYRTYESFPKSCSVSPIKLSRAGFYYTGIQDQTVCFSCDLKYKNWHSEDSPLEIHRQMSPDCDFMKGTDGRNVAIERDDDSKEHQQHDYEIIQQENGASGGADECNQSTQYEYVTQKNHAERTIKDSKEARTNELNEGISFNDVNSVGSNESKRPPYISFDRATHPHYATLLSRLSSFTGWLGLTSHKPRDLASAGFFYVGTGDSVRCFFCGGGLRNWQNGDEPYAEHARWYPECGYIQIYRGDEQVQVSSRNTESSLATFEAQSDTAQKELKQNALRTTAAQCVLSMGYTIKTVTQAIEMLRINQGTNFTAEQIIEIILDKEGNQSNNSNALVRQRVKDSCQKHTDMSSSKDINKDELTNTGIEIQDSSATTASSKDFESILEENRELKEQMTCKICMDAEACIVFLPCSHMVACSQCAPAFRKCPICRALVRGTVRASKS